MNAWDRRIASQIKLINPKAIAVLLLCLMGILLSWGISQGTLHLTVILAGVSVLLSLFLVLSRAYLYILIYFALTSLFLRVHPFFFAIEWYLPGGIVVNYFGVLNGLMTVFFIVYTIQKKRNWLKYPLGSLLLGLWALAMVNLVLSGLLGLPSVNQGITRLTFLGNWISVYFLLFDSVRTRRNAIQVVVVYLITLAVLAVSVLYASIVGNVQIAETQFVRAYGLGHGPTGVGELLALASVVCVSWLLIKGMYRKLYVSGLLFLFLVALQLTLSRAPIIALIFALLFILCKQRTKGSAVIALISICSAIYMVFMNPRIDALSVSSGQVDRLIYVNFFARLDAWDRFLIRMTPSSLITGNGIGSTDLVLHASHNDYVRFLYELGLPGLLLSVAFLVIIYKSASRVYTKAEDTFVRFTALASMGITLIISFLKFSGDVFFNGAIYGLVFFGALALSSQSWEKLEREEVPWEREGFK